jgi:hypothetical protein
VEQEAHGRSGGWKQPPQVQLAQHPVEEKPKRASRPPTTRKGSRGHTDSREEPHPGAQPEKANGMRGAGVERRYDFAAREKL